MSAGNISFDGRRWSRQRGRIVLRTLFATLNTLSFLALIWRVWCIAYASCSDVPFHWLMLTYVLGGGMIPLALIGCVALINALFWEHDGAEE